MCDDQLITSMGKTSFEITAMFTLKQCTEIYDGKLKMYNLKKKKLKIVKIKINIYCLI